jgi:LysM repeat protein
MLSAFPRFQDVGPNPARFFFMASVIYIVRSGDTLSKIARDHYGNANRWREIFEANRNIIKNPNMIHVGWKLSIPNITIDHESRSLGGDDESDELDDEQGASEELEADDEEGASEGPTRGIRGGKRQKLVSVELSDGNMPASHMFPNDPDYDEMGGNDEAALPVLLKAGWRIVKIVPMNGSSTALVLLEKR